MRKILIFISFFCGYSFAEIHHVPGDFLTIQDAINASSDGDAVHISSGTYYESINLLGKAIQVIGIEGAASTTVDASGLDASVVVCDSNETAKTVISGITITGGTGTLHPVWENLHGGGFYIYLSSPTITDCIVIGNQAEFAGGIWAQEYFSTMNNVTFESNQATYPDVGGAGGLYLWNSSAIITNCVFESNESAGPGGAMRTKISNSNSEGHSFIQNCIFNANTATTFGGAIASYSSTPTFEQCSFTNNSAAEFAGAFNIGGSMGADQHVAFTNCDFDSNMSGSYGGAVRIHQVNAQFDSCTFSLNNAPSFGGAIAVTGTAGPANCTISGSTIQNNISALGGAIFNQDAGVSDIESTSICDNGAEPIVGEWNDLGDNVVSVSCDSPCTGDIDADGFVNKDDVVILIEDFGPCNIEDSCFADLNEDGQVSIDDLLLIFRYWGTCD